MDISIGQFLQITQPVSRVFVWGMMGVGKSTFAKQLAHLINWEWIDLDAAIESHHEQSITTLFEQGEDAFRSKESEALKRLAFENQVVVSVGGGTPCFNNQDEWMKEEGLCIWLDAPVGMMAQRLVHAKQARPLLEGLDQEGIKAKLNELLMDRQQHYQKAHMIVNALKGDVRQVADQLKPIIQDKG